MATCKNTKNCQETVALQKQSAAELSAEESEQRMNLVVVGHVDHGKSTVIGRLLSDTDSLPEGKLEQVRAACEESGKQFEYAFLLDALVDERAQGITIDSARVFFKTEKRHYIIIDAPGHIEFLKNMVTGASHAEAALLVIDAEEGVQENSRRHGYMLSLLGVSSVVVLINKMDLVDFREEVYTSLVDEYTKFLSSIGMKALHFLPVSGITGDGIAKPSSNMPWFKGPTVLVALDQLNSHSAGEGGPLRMYVQDVYKFTKYGDNRRIIAGTIDSGTLEVGDQVVFYPSAKKTRVASLECFNAPSKTQATSGESIGFTLSEQIYIARGELATLGDHRPPEVTTRLKVSLFWLAPQPMLKNKDYDLKIGTAKVSARLEEVVKVIDAGDLSVKADLQQVERNQVAECVVKLNRAIAFDEVDQLKETSRFVIVDDFRIGGGGIIRSALDDSQSELRERTFARNRKWIHGLVGSIDRAEKYSQKPMLLLITGEREVNRKMIGKALEACLFREGKIVYFLGIGNILYGLDADIEGKEDIGQEHIRRLAELANIMLDAGLLLVISAANLTQADLALVGALVGQERLRAIWFGPDVSTDIEYDLHLPEVEDIDTGVDQIKHLLYENNIIFKPW